MALHSTGFRHLLRFANLNITTVLLPRRTLNIKSYCGLNEKDNNLLSFNIGYEPKKKKQNHIHDPTNSIHYTYYTPIHNIFPLNKIKERKNHKKVTSCCMLVYRVTIFFSIHQIF